MLLPILFLPLLFLPILLLIPSSYLFTWLVAKYRKANFKWRDIVALTFNRSIISSTIALVLACAIPFALVLVAENNTPAGQKFECCGLFEGGFIMLLIFEAIFLIIYSILFGIWIISDVNRIRRKQLQKQ